MHAKKSLKQTVKTENSGNLTFLALITIFLASYFNTV